MYFGIPEISLCSDLATSCLPESSNDLNPALHKEEMPMSLLGTIVIKKTGEDD